MHDRTPANQDSQSERDPIAPALLRIGRAADPVEAALRVLAGLPSVQCAAFVRWGTGGDPVIMGVEPRLLPGSPTPPWIQQGLAGDHVDGTALLEVGGAGERVCLILRSESGLSERDVALAEVAGGVAVGAQSSQEGEPRSEDDGVHKALHLLRASNDFDRPDACLRAVCDAAAAQFGADRASVVLAENDIFRVAMTSHAERVEQKAAEVRLIADAGAECIDQACVVRSDRAQEDGAINRASRDLATLHGSAGSAVAVPMATGGEAIGALVLERFDRPGPDASEIRALEVASALLVRRVQQLGAAGRPIASRARSAMRRAGVWLVGPRHTWIKLLGGAAALFLVVALLGSGSDFRTAEATVRSSDERVVAAPFDGFVLRGFAREGDLVDGGQTLIAEFDTSDLALELARARASLAATQTEAARLRESGELAESAVAEARADEIRAEIDLLEHRLGRAKLVAPISGVVAEGDALALSGARVTQGQVIARVVDPDRVEFDLLVPQVEFDGIAEGSTGTVVMPAFPDERIRFEITAVGLLGDFDSGGGILARARIENAPEWLAPGMSGSARIDVGKRRLLSIWSREIVNWVRLQLWL